MNTLSDQPRGKRWLWLGLALAAVLLLVFFGFVRKPAPGPGATPQDTAAAPKAAMTVTVTQPTSDSLPIALQTNGNISAWQEASVGAELGGLRLATVNVNVGDTVRRGQVLATFARETTEAESLQGKAAQMQAEASYENAKADADRARTIQDTGALSKSQLQAFLDANI